MMETREETEAKEKQRRDQDFASWLDDPMTRMCISTIPAAERPEALQLLLRAAFDKGFTCGACHMIGSVVTALTKPPPRGGQVIDLFGSGTNENHDRVDHQDRHP